jgi:hypothetical protein
MNSSKNVRTALSMSVWPPCRNLRTAERISHEICCWGGLILVTTFKYCLTSGCSDHLVCIKVYTPFCAHNDVSNERCGEERRILYDFRKTETKVDDRARIVRVILFVHFPICLILFTDVWHKKKVRLRQYNDTSVDFVFHWYWFNGLGHRLYSINRHVLRNTLLGWIFIIPFELKKTYKKRVLLTFYTILWRNM